MKRRRFLTNLGAGAAGLAALSGTNLNVWAQDYSKDYPLHCPPPPPGGTPQAVTLIKRSFVPRKSAFDLSTIEIQRLRDAYAAMRELSIKDPKDPRGWRQQANVHCYYCSGGYDTIGTEIHGNWSFLPWHRCYLYMHERILGALIGYPDFRLPYWDWDTIPDVGPNSRRTVPPVYDAANYQVTQPTTMSIANSLLDRTRAGSSTYVIPDETVGKVAIKTVMCQTGENFMGGPGIEGPQSNGQAGQLEQSPHGPVHLWTGDPRTEPNQPAPFGCFYPTVYPYDPTNPNSYPTNQTLLGNPNGNGCVDMGVLATAAQDPIFFSHHANIDRLWDIWNRIPQPGHTNPTDDPNWMGMGWSFYDENKNWITISASQVLDEKTLGYSYQPPQVKGYTTTTNICATAKVTKTAARGQSRSSQSLTVAADQKGIIVGAKPHTQTITLPPEHRTQLQLLGAGSSQMEYVLHIDGISLPPNGGTIIRVFLNLPEATVRTMLDSQHFAGYISVVPSGLGHRHPVVRNVAFDLLPELAATVAAKDQFSVTLVPVTAGGAEPLQGAVRYKRIYLTAK